MTPRQTRPRRPRPRRPRRSGIRRPSHGVLLSELDDDVVALIERTVPQARAVTEDDARTAMHRERGRKAKRSGDTLEQAMERTHEMYAARDLACMAHLHPETRGPRDRLFRSKPGECDYMGWWQTPNGPRPLAFDLKSSSCATLRLPTLPSARKSWQHQLKFLIRYGSVPGAYAAFFVVDRELGFGWLLFPARLKILLDDGEVPVRTKVRGTGTIVHHLPHFTLATVEDLARNRPLLDWHPVLHAHAFPGVPVR